ncbi:crustacean calcium-binding protein 23-like [Oratosquilla oratoria]|uniref:crustacean calcium-binding protein 23-like n=1 Tax=Oratosquilla oratoria TaxID=337810 RepID=UPI003F770EB8
MSETETKMKEAAEALAGETSDAAEKLRSLCMTRGYNGILSLGRFFRRLDEDNSGTLNLEELQDAVIEFGIEMDKEEVEGIMKEFQQDDDATVNYEEFLASLRPPLSDARVEVIGEAFDKMDASGDGVITLEDIQGVYSASQHPKVLEGVATEEEILTRFLHRFEGNTVEDGKVQRHEFLDYYSGVSNSIDDDEYFVTMMKICWKLEE